MLAAAVELVEAAVALVAEPVVGMMKQTEVEVAVERVVGQAAEQVVGTVALVVRGVVPEAEVAELPGKTGLSVVEVADLSIVVAIESDRAQGLVGCMGDLFDVQHNRQLASHHTQ